MPTTETFDLAVMDSMKSLHQAEIVARYMASKCTGEKFVAVIQGKPYPTVAWWTTVGAAFGLFPMEVMSRRLARPYVAYESLVEVRSGGRVIGRGSAICSSQEIRWSGRDEYAVKSMATTRATGRAFKLPFSFLAVLAGLEATPAEEMTYDLYEPKAKAKPRGKAKAEKK